ncbi:MAG TPA: phosphate acyltransferase PlsX [Lachnospiraceae bacterium]|nr:phosphate acyltransferase PlsX [Lachnospiraceae bacterium]
MSDVIAIDAMGGDNAPESIVQGAVEALEKVKYKIALVGKKEIIDKELSKYTYDKERITVVNADEVIENCETPTIAIKKKKNSSMVVGLNMVKNSQAAAFISAGNTGALLTGATLIVGRIKGIERPALGTLLPTEKGRTLLIDAGANVDAKPSYFPQFALMGSIYVENVLGISSPRVGLVNIGTEEEKGNTVVKEAYGLLNQTKNINFQGNAEARDITKGDFDVVVCDAFVGNVILKFMEGFAHSIFRMIKEEVMKKLIYKVGMLLAKGAFKKMLKMADYDTIGGAPFLGLKGLVVKAHGASDNRAVVGAVTQCAAFMDADIVGKIEQAVKPEENESL